MHDLQRSTEHGGYLPPPSAQGWRLRLPRAGWRAKLNAAAVMLCLVAGAAFSYWRGQDINFDQLNYHYYIAHAFWTSRLDQDVAPSQVVHSFLNPIVYLPFYLMVRHFPPLLVGMVLGALHGLNLFLVGVIAWMVTPSLKPPQRITSICAALVISAASPMAISEFGTSMADLIVSLPVLCGVALLIGAEFRPGRTGWALFRILLGGALVGAATSLKLTSAPFAIALVSVAMVCRDTWLRRLVAAAVCAAGGAAGFAAGGGFWYLDMWRRFGNPVFPYFNTLFRSPDYPTTKSFFDDRFEPKGLVEAFRYPFEWANAQHTTSELIFRDTRFAIIIILAAAAVSFRAASRRAGVGKTVLGIAPGLRLTTFFAIALALWFYEWSIQRYIVVLELLCGPVMVALSRRLDFWRFSHGWGVPAVCAAIAIASSTTVIAPEYGHLDWSTNWYDVEIVPSKSDHPVYFLDDEAPLAYVVSALPPGSTAIGLVAWENYVPMGNPALYLGDTVFRRRIMSLITDAKANEFWAISVGPFSNGFNQAITHLGLKPDGHCETTPGRPVALTSCRLTRIASGN